MMSKPNTVFPLRQAYPFATARGLRTDVERIRNDLSFPPGFSRPSSVRRGHMIELFEKQGILEEFIRKHWPEGRGSWGETRMAYYKRLKAAHGR